MNKKYYKTRAEWEEMRQELICEGRIGGSMVGTAAGLDPWKSPYTMWAELTGRRPIEDISKKEAVRLGHDLEDYVAKRFEEVSGKKVHRENCILTNDAYPHLFASIDRKISNEESGLECKTANAYRDGAFAEGNFPDGYFRQVKTYLAVTGLERWYLAVLIMGVDFRVFCVTTKLEDFENPPSWCESVRYVSPMELEECEEDAAKFMGYVVADTPPPMVGTDDERGVINELNGNKSEGATSIDINVEQLIRERAELKAKGDADKEELKRIENEIIAALNGREMGVGTNYKVTYHWGDTKRIDTKKLEEHFAGKVPDELYKVTNSPTLRIYPIKKNFK